MDEAEEGGKKKEGNNRWCQSRDTEKQHNYRDNGVWLLRIQMTIPMETESPSRRDRVSSFFFFSLSISGAIRDGKKRIGPLNRRITNS